LNPLSNFLSRIHLKYTQLPQSVKHYIALSFTSAITQVTKLFTGTANARFLTPTLYGINSLSSVFVRYTSYAHLGIQNGLNRQIPIEIGRKNEDDIDKYLYSTFSILLLLSVFLICTTLFLYSFPIKYDAVIPKSYYFSILLLCISTLFFQFFYSYLVCKNQFPFISKLKLKYDFIGTIASVAIVYFFRLHGLLFFQSFMLIVQIFFIIQFLSFSPKLLFSLPHLKILLIAGFPVLINSVSSLFLGTVDILYIAKTFDKSSIGHYGLALTSVAFFSVYITSISDILQPKIGYRYGQNNEEKSSLWNFAEYYSIIFIPIMSIIMSVFFYILPLVIAVFLPAYNPSISIFKNLLLATFFNSIFIPCGHITTVLRKQIIFIVLNVLLGIVSLTIFNLTLTGNSNIVLISLFMLGISYIGVYLRIFITFRYLNFPISKNLKTLFKIFIISTSFAIIYLSSMKIAYFPGEPFSFLFIEIIKFLIVLCISIATFVLINKDKNLLNIYKLKILK